MHFKSKLGNITPEKNHCRHYIEVAQPMSKIPFSFESQRAELRSQRRTGTEWRWNHSVSTPTGWPPTRARPRAAGEASTTPRIFPQTPFSSSSRTTAAKWGLTFQTASLLKRRHLPSTPRLTPCRLRTIAFTAWRSVATKDVAETATTPHCRTATVQSRTRDSPLGIIFESRGMVVSSTRWKRRRFQRRSKVNGWRSTAKKYRRDKLNRFVLASVSFDCWLFQSSYVGAGAFHQFSILPANT